MAQKFKYIRNFLKGEELLEILKKNIFKSVRCDARSLKILRNANVKCKWSLQFSNFFPEASEPIEWDPQGAFINNVATKVYYVVPAFLAGLMTGVILWACYIFTFKIGNAVKKMTKKSSEPSEADEESDQEAYQHHHPNQRSSSPSAFSTSSIASSEVEDQIIIRSKGL